MTVRALALCCSVLALAACGGESIEDLADRGDVDRTPPSWEEMGAVPDQPRPAPDSGLSPDAGADLEPDAGLDAGHDAGSEEGGAPPADGGPGDAGDAGDADADVQATD